ncbi:MAG TPA: hypothetical protein ENJ22_04675 [Gammaproteobacteria bacterium]|nr:hypothetical protein [Gammaproteobacteria bacterium]
MQFTLDRNSDSYGIHAYAAGEITITIPRSLDQARPREDEKVAPLQPPVRRETLHHSLILMPQRLIQDWPPRSFEDLGKAHFDILAELDVEMIVLGTGARLRWPAHDMLSALRDKGMGIEVMDTGAACRTYNILMADRRRFAAALLMI